MSDAGLLENRTARLLICFSICLFVGCGGSDSDRPDLGQVSGTIKLNGEPLPFATVTFWPESGGRTSFGISNELGYYELKYQGGSYGAKLGLCRVSVTTQSEDIYDEESGEILIRPAQDERVPREYNDNSQLEFIVESGENTANFDLVGAR